VSISSNDLRTGITIELDGEIWSVVEFMHVKPGKGSAFVRTRLRNIRTGNVRDMTFRAGEKLTRAILDTRLVQYLYESDGLYTFMDQETYDQYTLGRDQLGDDVLYLKEGMELHVRFYQGKVVGVELPNSVVLEIVDTEPGVRGDTAAGGTKPARLETGLVVQVPLFVEAGEKVEVDTRTGQYLGRA